MNYKKAFYAFLRALIVTTLVVASISALIYWSIPNEYYTKAFPFLLGFFFLATLMMYHFMLKALEKRPARFVNAFMLTTLVKLLGYMTIMIVYALINKEDGRAFIIAFFVLYVVYTVVEVVSLLSINRQNNFERPKERK